MGQFFFNHQEKGRLTPIQEKALKEAYLMFYALAGAKKADHFVWTSSGAEAVNHAIFSAYLDITRKTGKNHFLCGALEEAPTILSMSRLHDLGSVFQKIAVNQHGIVTAQALTEMITPRTAMLSLSCANGLTGVVQPLQEIKSLCQERGILLHLEATHVLGKSDFSLAATEADLLTFDGPNSVMGGMFIKEGIEISPFILGGNEQGGMRGAPLNPSAILESATWAKKQRSYADHYMVEIARLRALFEEKLSRCLPDVYPLFVDQERVSFISCIVFHGVMSEALAFLLKQKGVLASLGGNHCQQLPLVLKGCGVKEPEKHSALSFAFNQETTEEEIEKGCEIIIEAVLYLRKCSDFLLKEALCEL